MEINFKLDGDKRLSDNLKKINRAAQGRALKRAAKAGASPVVESAKNRVAVDTGRTKRSIRSWPSGYRQGEATESVGVTAPTRADVARFLETGTSKTPAQPFLRPAIDEDQKRAAEATQEEMAQAALEEARSLGH